MVSHRHWFSLNGRLDRPYGFIPQHDGAIGVAQRGCQQFHGGCDGGNDCRLCGHTHVVGLDRQSAMGFFRFHGIMRIDNCDDVSLRQNARQFNVVGISNRFGVHGWRHAHYSGDTR